MATTITRNPYIGPRPFEADEAELYFGREQEARTLLSLVTINRVVLFYAQSGAGKSSLINTRLVPGLQAKGFEVLPVGRVGGGLEDQATNTFTYNLMLSLEQSGRTESSYLSGLNLADFLAGLFPDESAENHYRYDPTMSDSEAAEAESEPAAAEELIPRALIIDQFEEILTSSLHRWPQRKNFFEQLAQALEVDSHLWLVLVMRSDYVAGLDPYADLLPGRLRSRYFMQRMKRSAALEAVEKPLARQGMYQFAAGVTEQLVDNLCQIRVYTYEQTAAQATIATGEFVEPVQLQLVCYELWERLQAKT